MGALQAAANAGMLDRVGADCNCGRGDGATGEADGEGGDAVRAVPAVDQGEREAFGAED